MSADLVKLSKFLSRVLRHQPQSIGLVLDAGGWTLVDDLLTLARGAGVLLDRDTLKKVVDGSDKQRFAFSEDGTRIRANYGHSLRVQVDLDLPPVEPPEFLYHGTATRFLGRIREQGLVSGRRRYVHLSVDGVTALQVGRRHGEPVILRIRAQAMYRQGYCFYVSGRSVWLTNHVPAECIETPPSPVRRKLS